MFDRVPPGMQASPVLTVELQSPSAGKERLELDYLTSGLSWQANYVAELDAEGKRMDFSGWAMIANRSETPFENAGVQLVAGSLNRATAQPVMFAALRSEAKIDAAAPNGLRSLKRHSRIIICIPYPDVSPSRPISQGSFPVGRA